MIRGFFLRRSRTVIVSGVCLSVLLNAGLAGNWPSWRGPDGNSVSPEAGFPETWGPEKNVRWKAPLPGPGNSSPVVWGERVFVTQAVEDDHRRTLMCFDRHTGRLLWQAGTVYAEPEETHRSNPYCAASPVTDGERVIVTYGSAGVFCYDMEGAELWRRDLGPQVHIWGNASSPLLHGDLCILYHGPGDYGAMVALDAATGDLVWKVKDRPIATAGRTDGFRGNEPGNVGSFSTPILIEAGGGLQLVMSYPNEVAAFEPGTGQRIWWCGGLNPLVYTSPLWDGETLVAMGGYFGDLVALRPEGTGDITSTARLWREVRAGGSVGTGVIHGDFVYYGDSGGIAICRELKTGREVWKERLRGPGAKTGSWSSMTLSGDRIYLLNQSADTFVVAASPEFRVIAVNSLGGEMTNSTQAMSEGELFIRTYEHLWCISERRQVAQAD